MIYVPIYKKQSQHGLKYRVYYTYASKKIYIGLYETLMLAEQVLAYVTHLMHTPFTVDAFDCTLLSFPKFIELLNFKDHNIYFSAPIYLTQDAFKYYITPDTVLTFDMKDLFFFSNYRIHQRGNYFFINIGPQQENILHRFGILNYATYGIDYTTLNGDPLDLRRSNLQLLSHYRGVQYAPKHSKPCYVARVRHKQSIVVGHYEREVEAAVAYNKAMDYLVSVTPHLTYEPNEFPFLTRSEYQVLYDKVTISKRFGQPGTQNRVFSNKTYRGVSRDKNGFRALIGFQSKQIYLGTYPTEKRAAQAYNYASFYLYGSKGYINQVTPLTAECDHEKIALRLEKADVLKHPLSP